MRVRRSERMRKKYEGELKERKKIYNQVKYNIALKK